ncbi:hypothetical protein BS47DRAFT_1374400 [Hydnum rufescens UP504]|uniref:Uncharacterized protein n=1 Tax=Hydnum rufescens UP504 TaxID=1448309 RepID=A0A9P6AEG8_9AGAM|nr:hypothetical protein BS47DRAFT_1374400 [Hydnum rufescens UP504]
MVSDFVSANYGYLHTPDGSRKNHDGYFDNEDLKKQIIKAMEIHGRSVVGTDGKTIKEMKQMHPGKLLDGSMQSFYFSDSHKSAGQFKGMAVILQEHGIPVDELKLKAQCGKGGFKCWFTTLPTGSNPCCCWKALYDQPDFIAQKSIIQELIEAHGHGMTIYAKFHCECNFIEQIWGYAKQVYHEFPESSTEAEPERNVLAALESVPLISIRRFANCSLRFMDAYRKGLNGSQAAWANKKYHGHRVLPESLMADLEV